MTPSNRLTGDHYRTSPALRRLSLLALCLLQAFAGSGNANAAPGDEPTRLTAATASAQDAGPDAARAKGIAPQPFRYVWLAASTFVPLASSASYTYSGNGCISKVGDGEARFAHKLLLPPGRVVKFIRLYAYDYAVDSDITAYFTTYDALGAFNEVETVSSQTLGSYGSFLSPEMTHVVDTFNAATNIVVNLGVPTDGSLKFCAVRIAYVDELLPDVFANGFE